ncbi:MAG TPA: CHAT domain-containing tetratricopeptide repeat protein [Thermoanaerobaculia bacterium]
MILDDLSFRTKACIGLLLLCLAAVLLGATLSGRPRASAPVHAPPAERREEGLLARCKAHLEESSDAATTRRCFERALPALRANGDRHAQAVALDGLGRARFRLGELQEAHDLYQEALALFRALGAPTGEAEVLSNLALVHKRWGEAQDALSLFRKALDRLPEVGAESARGVILYNLGELNLATGRPQEALESFQRAFPLLRDKGHTDTGGRALSGAGEAYGQLGLHLAARRLFRQAVEWMLRNRDHSGLVLLLSREASLHLFDGNHQEALALFEKALGLARAIKDRRGEAVALAGLARCYDLMGRDAEAVRLFAQARPQFEEFRERDAVAAVLYRSAQALRDLGRLAEARSAIEESLAVTESLRVEPLPGGTRSSYLASVRERYHFTIDLYLRLHREDPAAGFGALAFEAAESARARAVLDELSGARADLEAEVGPDLVARKRDLLRRRRTREGRRAELVVSPQTAESVRELAEIEREIGDLEAGFEAALAEIREESPRYAELTQPRPWPVPEIQRELLDGETLLLSYFLGEPRSFVWLIGRNSLAVRELADGDKIELVAVKLAGALAHGARRDAQEQAREAAEALSEMLLEPIAEELTAERLIIVADGALRGIPFGALPDPRRPNGEGAEDWFSRSLLARHQIAMAPSASALGVLRRQLRGRRPAPRPVAVLADPVFGDLKRLVHTRAEAEAIRAALARPEEGLFLTGFAADLQAATSMELSQFRIVHFATHGLFSGDPDRSGIVLSDLDERGRPRPGFLRAADVYGLDLPVELVVLSACRTAGEEEVKGDGLGLLTRGFFYAGARRVVVSLWEVNDEATARLMARFYHGMLQEGLSPAEALRTAQLAISRQKGWEAPYYWAGFVLQGDW